MSNFLDDLFAAGVDTVPYSWTFTDVEPLSRKPEVAFGTGEFALQSLPDPRHIYYIPPKRYIDRNIKVWRAAGFDVAPPAFSVTATWVNQLVIMNSPSGYFIRYGNASNFDVEQATFFPTLGDGGRFPGIPEIRTGILTAPTWTGVMQLVLVLPDGNAQMHASQGAYQSSVSQGA